jgi:RNHCP domain
MPKQFFRNVENFTCSNCGLHVKGNGYTDHCPKCLWSKHVDVNPGDRASECKGMMKPIRVLPGRKNTTIDYICTKCGMKKSVEASKDDYEHGSV